MRRKGGEEEEKGREVKRKVGRKDDREGGGGKVGGIMYKYLPSTLVPYSHTVKCTHIQ